MKKFGAFIFFIMLVLAGCGGPTLQVPGRDLISGSNLISEINWNELTGAQVIRNNNGLQVLGAGTTEIRYRLNGQCNTLDGTVGIDPSASSDASAQFLIFKDDQSKPIYSSLSALTKSDKQQNIETLDISDAKDLRVVVMSQGQDVRANWQNLKINCQISDVGPATLKSQADTLTPLPNRLRSPDNLRDASIWQLGPAMVPTISTTAVPITEDSDGTLDLLKSNAGYQWLRTDIAANAGETLEVSLMLSGTTGSSLQLNLRSFAGVTLAGSGTSYVRVSPTPTRVVIGRFTKPDDGTPFVRLLLTGITPSDTIYAGGIRVFSVSNDTALPAASASLVATASSNSVTLSWAAVANASNYEIERKAGAGLFSALVAPSVSPYTDLTAASGITYTYRVRAKNGNGVGPWTESNPVTVGNIGSPPTDGRIISPENLRDPSWSGGPSLVPSLSTVAVSTTEDSDGTLDLLKSSAGYQWWQTRIKANAGETLEVSLMLSGTAGSSLQLNIRSLFGVNLAGSGSVYIPVSPTPRRVVVGRFTKPNDGVNLVTLILAGITSSDTIYAGGVRVAVVGDTPPVIGSFTVSSNNVITTSTIQLNATATDNVGVTKVEFIDTSGGANTLLTTDTTAPYSSDVALTAANNGSRTYLARAYDTTGQITISAPVTVTVAIPVPDTTPPTITLSGNTSVPGPINVVTPSEITLNANATDNIAVTKVEFFEGTTLLGTDTTAPYENPRVYAVADNGTHTYTAKAFDAAGNSTLSNTLNVNVNIPVSDTTLPTVSLASTSNSVTAAGKATLTATANDNVGVTKVEFYEGTILLGTDTDAPYEWPIAFISANNGTHTYFAKAGDAAGNVGTSTAVNVVVNIVNIVNIAGTSISAGTNHSLVITPEGALWAFGNNSYGQLGDGTTQDRYTPVQIMTDVASASAGADHSLALKTDGTLWSFGSNGGGQLGSGPGPNKSTPMQIMSGVTSISAGSEISLILKSDGTLWTAGYNVFGQLGDGANTNRDIPVQIMTGVATMSAGLYHSLVVKTDGTLWAFGHNYYGQLGDGTGENHNTPVQIMTGVSKVSAGNYHSLVLKIDGTLWAFGWNMFGQLGNGTTIGSSIPVQVMTDVTNIDAGGEQSFAIKTDGTLWAFGFNFEGQLGDGTTEQRIAPIQIMSGVTSISTGHRHSLALKTNGTLWAFGGNYAGRLGDGTNINRYFPVQIMTGTITGIHFLTQGALCANQVYGFRATVLGTGYFDSSVHWAASPDGVFLTNDSSLDVQFQSPSVGTDVTITATAMGNPSYSQSVVVPVRGCGGGN